MELVRKLMQGDHYTEGAQLAVQCVWNPFKVAVLGRAEAIRRYEDMLLKNEELLRILPQLS